ncbi:hypothetical protein F4553_006703 [Allocatelliglobosispora scoriae]|uniref:DUF7144 domain-containing protein n=1 Tax=Allocatelliglobosispora scoriae TaxID=643052 RepID=A0A841C1R9_9ACTN|nr:hypothetical protein [Allocatelliglobosispora scoriae]MBB5873269.1 hypothetical protein [Allocatelliglobosispora scoriae]
MTTSNRQALARGGLVFAATMFLMLGVFQVVQGLAGIIKSEFFITTRNYAFTIDTSVWGWIHFILGLLMVAIGWFLFSGATWARGAGVAVAVASAIANFFWLPYYPWWALLIIALDVYVIWALTTARFDD